MSTPLVFERPEWFDRGACRGVDPELFFPGQGADARPAKAVCAVCPVRAECLEFGLTERFGIWGGYSERERRRMRRALQKLRVVSAA